MRARMLAGDVDDDTSSLSSLSSDDSSSGAASPPAALGQRIELIKAMEDDHLPINANNEQERRDAALAFRMRVESVHDVVLSIPEAIFLLYLADWDTGSALAQFQGHAEARNRLRIAFDSLRDRTDDPNEQSVRLAAMLEICERANWLSVKIFLEKKRYNLVRAVIAWYKSGIPPFTDNEARNAPKTNPHWGLRVDHNGRLRQMPGADEWRAAPSNAEQSGWASATSDFTNPGDTSPPTPHVHSSIHGKNYTSKKDRPPGFILRAGSESFIRVPFRAEKERPNTVQPGPADPSKFLLEYISKGHYKFNLFKLEKYFFSDRVDDVHDNEDNDSYAADEDSPSSSSSDSDSAPAKTGGKRKRGEKTTGRTAATPRKRSKNLPAIKPCVEFDFSTPSHLVDINSWRRQNGSRIEGRVRRLAAQAWTQEELELLCKFTHQRHPVTRLRQGVT